ncbi:MULTISPECIES: VTT domain-containing protein [unclassified Frankia]|uniref:VTT domain-containing protein n=1 Tax=unclassified Frankia TaxID=2632575 RepID=UPI002025B127
MLTASTLASTTLALGPSFLDAEHLAKAGLIVILLIVFAESGLLIGFFLPGDSLLFTVGLLVSNGRLSTPLWLACVLISIAAVAGDQAGFLFGRKAGPTLFRRPDSRLFRQENVEKAHDFFERYGPRSVILARFVPIVRTFTPIVAGVSGMNYRLFVTFNIIGGLLWGTGVTVIGYFLGKVEFVAHNVEKIFIGIVLLSVIPIGFELLRARRRGGRPGSGAAPGAAPGAARHSARSRRTAGTD